jgi:CheY-like chemotaxis protein
MSATFSNAPILLVEDDDQLREALTLLLEDEGYVVSGARDGVQALRRLATTEPTPAVILLDLMMPNMNGFRFREEQLKVPAYASIPVVALTAGRHTEQLERQIRADAFVSKPFNLPHLLKLIERMIDARCIAGF